MKNQFMLLISAAILFSSVSIGSAMAQNQGQNQSSLATVPENQTMATVSDSTQTVILNQITVPAEQTTVTVNQTTETNAASVSTPPLENQSITPETGNLSNIENKIMVQPTDPATTVIANKTTVPFNQTTIGAGNSTQQFSTT